MNATSIRNLKFRALAALVFGTSVCLSAASTRANTLNMDFEQPTYNVGTLASTPAFSGQGGWSNQFDGLAQVSNTQVLAGAQSLVEAGDGTVRFYNFHQADTASAGMNWTDGGSVSALLQIADQSVAANDQEIEFDRQGTPGNSTTAIFLTDVAVSGGILSWYNGTYNQLASGMVSGDVYSLVQTLNFTNGTYTVSWQDLTAGGPLNISGPLALSGSPTLAELNAGSQVGLYSQGPGTAIWDNIVLNDGQVAVPEPSTIIQLVLGALGLAAFRRFKR